MDQSNLPIVQFENPMGLYLEGLQGKKCNMHCSWTKMVLLKDRIRLEKGKIGIQRTEPVIFLR